MEEEVPFPRNGAKEIDSISCGRTPNKASNTKSIIKIRYIIYAPLVLDLTIV